MSIIQSHSHRGMVPTGYRTRDIKVAKGVDIVRVPEAIYDEDDVVMPCPYCYNAGVDAERDIADALADALLSYQSWCEGDLLAYDGQENVDRARVALAAYEATRAT